ncbi:MAG: hypothetical protein NZ869_11425, partial [Thermoanaerobaculum sp.]|nr:hypothetical protein [Thermoanaerobaculum sp.]
MSARPRQHEVSFESLKALLKPQVGTRAIPSPEVRWVPSPKGALRVLAAPQGWSFQLEENRNQGPEAAALGFVKRFAPLLGMEGEQWAWEVKRVVPWEPRSVVHLQPLRGQLPVFGAGVVVQLDQNRGVEFLLADIGLGSTTGGGQDRPPAFAQDLARKAAEDFVQQRFRLRVTASAGQLVFFDPTVVGTSGMAQPSWEFLVSDGAGTVAEVVLVSALSGEVVFHYSEIHQALYREIYDCLNIFGFSGFLVRAEGQGPVGVPEVDLAYDYLGDTYQFFFTRFGRDSVDGQGLPLRARVRVCLSALCWEQNAWWDPSSRGLSFTL